MPKPARQVLICTNSRPADSPKGCCASKGSEAMAGAIKDLLRKHGLWQTVMVQRTSCLKHCSRGVTLAVQPDNVWYAGVQPQDLEELLESHLRDGRPVERLLMPDIPWE